MSTIRLLCAGFTLLAALLLVACSTSKPEAVAEAFYQALIERDLDKAIEYLDMDEAFASGLSQHKGEVQMNVDEFASEIEKNGGLKRFELVQSEIAEDGQTARVRITLICNNGEENTDVFRLRRKDGKWKISTEITIRW